MVAIEMQDIKARRGPRVSSQIDFGGQVSMKMSIRQSKTADVVNFMEGGKKNPYGPNDGYFPPPAGPSQLYFIRDDH